MKIPIYLIIKLLGTKKFIEYLNFKPKENNLTDSSTTERENTSKSSKHNLSIFSFKNNSHSNNKIRTRDERTGKTFQINFSKELIEEMFYHCFIVLFAGGDENSLEKAKDTFLPKINLITAKVDFEFILLMIGEVNHDKQNEVYIDKELRLLEMNFNRKKSPEFDMLNEVLCKKISQSYIQYPEYYDKSKQTAKHILNTLKVFDFERVLTEDQEEFLTFEENLTSKRWDLETCMNMNKNTHGNKSEYNLTDPITMVTEDNLCINSQFSGKKKQIINESLKVTNNNSNSKYNKNEPAEKHSYSFLKDLYFSKGNGVPMKVVNEVKVPKNKNINKIPQSNVLNAADIKKKIVLSKGAYNSPVTSKQTGHRRTYSENIIRSDINKDKPDNVNYSVTHTHENISPNPDTSIVLNLKVNYKSKDLTIMVNKNDTVDSLSNTIINKFSLTLSPQARNYLSKSITNKINKFINYICNDLDEKKYSNIIIDLNKIVEKSSKRSVQIVVTVNNQKLSFFVDYNTYTSVTSEGIQSKNDFYLDKVAEKTVRSIENNKDYDISSLKDSLKNIIKSSIKNTLKI